MHLHYNANWLMVYGEVITVYSKDHMESITKLCAKMRRVECVKACGTCSDHGPLWG